MSTPVYREQINHPAAWTSKSLGGQGKEALTYQLTPEQLGVIDGLLKKTEHLAPQQITRQDFDHPVFNAMLDELREIIMNGRGSVIIRGVDTGKYDAEKCERIFWGIGTHLGNATVQSVNGARLAHVRAEKDNPHARGYRTSDELSPHTDSFEVVGLMCLQGAETGGYSRLVSTLAIHNEILKTRPELLEPLYRGSPNAVLEARGTDKAISDGDVPIFSCVDGKVSCLFARIFLNEAELQTGKPLAPDFAEATKYFEKLANSDELRLHFMLEPGEMMIINNFVVLHSRTNFHDSEKNTRDLLRLWLNVEHGRPVIPEVFAWADVYEEMFRRRIAAARNMTNEATEKEHS